MKEDGDYEIDFDERILSPESGELVRPVRTIPLNEFKMREFCRENGIVSYLPLKKEWKVREYVKNGKSYRYSKIVMRPMFRSYIFVRLNDAQKAMLWASRKIARILTPASQEQFLMEIRAVHAFELTGLEQEVEFNSEIHEKDSFMIESGIWAGVSGWLEKREKHFEWVVWLDFANQYVRTTINPSLMKMRRLEQ